MIPDSRIWHILPVNDLYQHEDKARQNALGIFCDCRCEPEIKEEDGNYFIVHSSFDGREGLEQVAEILNNH